MEANPVLSAPATPTVVSSDDFFSDTPLTPAAPAPTPAAEPVPTPAPAAPVAPTPAITTSEPVLPNTGTTTQPATPPSTGTTPPAADPATPAIPDPATPEGAETDPWANLDLSSSDAAPPAPDATLTAIAQSLGLEAIPENPEQLRSALDAEVERRVQEATYDPIREIDQMLSASNRDLVRSELYAHRTRFDTQESLEERLDQIESEDRIDGIAEQIRAELNTARQGHQATRQQELQAQSQALIEAQQQMRSVAQAMKDPRGRDLPDTVKQTLVNYSVSGQYLQDLLNQPVEWHAQQAARLHPKIGPTYRAEEEKVMLARGATSVYKELEHQTPILGGGAALPPKASVVSSSDFYND